MADFESSSVYTDLEKQVLRYADGLSSTPAHADDELFAALRQELSDRQLTELTSAIAWKNYLARFNSGFQIESEELSEADFCLLPET